MVTLTRSKCPHTQEAPSVYIPRHRNVIYHIFSEHFQNFTDNYEEKYASNCGLYNLERIIEIVNKFLECGDYKEGLARITCTNPNCDYQYFRPFSCKTFYFCPSCTKKKSLLFGEYLRNELLLRLPHRHMTWTLPKALRVFLKNDKSLFAHISKMIFKLISNFYNLAACKSITTGCTLCYQSYGDLLRFNSHFHGVFLEGGFDKDGNFIFIPIHDTAKLTQSFRQMVVKYFYAKGLITNSFAQNLLSWKNSGFSIKNSFRIYGSEQKKMEAIGQYLTRAPISLRKLEYIKSKGNVIIHTKYNEYFKENLKLLKAEDFISLLVQHIPPARLHYIRYYGLYSSRSRGKWKDLPYVLRLAPEGWEKEKDDPLDDSAYEDNSVSAKAKRSAWARKQDIDLTHYTIILVNLVFSARITLLRKIKFS